MNAALSWALAGTLVFIATSAIAQEKVTVQMKGAAANMTACSPGTTLRLEIYPDKVRVLFSAGSEEGKLQPDGSYLIQTTRPGQVKLSISGNTKTRAFIVLNTGNLNCRWDGSY